MTAAWVRFPRRETPPAETTKREDIASPPRFLHPGRPCRMRVHGHHRRCDGTGERPHDHAANERPEARPVSQDGLASGSRDSQEEPDPTDRPDRQGSDRSLADRTAAALQPVSLTSAPYVAAAAAMLRKEHSSWSLGDIS